MGIINFGIPLAHAAHLKNQLGLKVAVEGGTYKGGTAKKLSALFDKVYTIEMSKRLHEEAKEALESYANVNCIHGHTVEHLDYLLIQNNNLLFWLDAHWSGGATYGELDECPLVEELRIIFKNKKNYVVLIDDARLFTAPPPKPHNLNVWPTISDICSIIPDYMECNIWDDVIYITPKSANFRMYLQLQTTFEWQNMKQPITLRCKSFIYEKIFSPIRLRTKKK